MKTEMDRPLAAVVVLAGLGALISGVVAFLLFGEGSLSLVEGVLNPRIATGILIAVGLGVSLYRESGSENMRTRLGFEWFVCAVIVLGGIGVFLMEVYSGTPETRFRSAIGSAAIAAGLGIAAVAGLLRQARWRDN